MERQMHTQIYTQTCWAFKDLLLAIWKKGGGEGEGGCLRLSVLVLFFFGIVAQRESIYPG